MIKEEKKEQTERAYYRSIPERPFMTFGRHMKAMNSVIMRIATPISSENSGEPKKKPDKHGAST